MSKNIIFIAGLVVLVGVAFVSWKFIFTDSTEMITEPVPEQALLPSQGQDITEQP